MSARKHQIVAPIQNKLLNPFTKRLIMWGLMPAAYALIETTGRRSGQPRQTPVGNGQVGDEFWIVAEHGMRAAYVKNIQADPRVRVRYREGRRGAWRAGTATLLPEDDPIARLRWLGTTGKGRAVNAAAVRTMGSSLLTVRVDLDRA
ncbi:MAG TPA: nitroreductase/quinone reductase family protein [Conexibacter sp.]